MKTLEQRLLARSRHEGECLLWTGHVNKAGYGLITVDRRALGVHRAAYETWVGPIPAGLEIDHLCRVRNCINPDHLEAVTHRENLARSSNHIARQIAQTECHRGHALPAYQQGVSRDCLGCQKERVNCELCGREMDRKSLSQHVRLSCPSRTGAGA